MIVQGSTAGWTDRRGDLELRVELPPDRPEDSKAAQTAGDRTIVAWPLAPETMIDYWMGNPWLAAIGNVLADAISAGRWELEAREADLDGKLIENRPRSKEEARQDDDYSKAMAWLGRENVGGDGVSELGLPSLMWTLARVYDQTGNMFVEVVRNRAADRPARLVNLLPQLVNYETGEQGLTLLQRSLYTGDTHFVRFGNRPRGDKNAREFIHQRLPNTVSSFYGVPLWTEARDSVAVDNAHRGYLKGFFRNHGTPRWLIEITQDPNWTGVEPTSDKLDALYNMVRGYLDANKGEMAGRNLVIQYPGGILVKATSLDHKLEDPTFGNTAKNARDEIMAVRHISLIDLGLPEGGYRATAEEQSANFRRQVLEPFAAPVVGLINRVLHAPEPHGLGVTRWDFRVIFDRVEDTLKRIEGIVKATGRPVLTADEGREIIGYETKGDDTLYVQSSMVPALALGEGGPDA